MHVELVISPTLLIARESATVKEKFARKDRRVVFSLSITLK